MLVFKKLCTLVNLHVVEALESKVRVNKKQILYKNIKEVPSH